MDLWTEGFRRQCSVIMEHQNGCMPLFGVFAPGRSCVAEQNDFSAMISAKLFADLCLPELAAQCDAVECPAYHLDGPDAVRHPDALLSPERLRAVEWVTGPPGKGLKQWVPMLRRVQDAGKGVAVRSTWLEDGDAGYIFDNLRPEKLFISISCRTKPETEDWIRKAERSASRHKRTK